LTSSTSAPRPSRIFYGWVVVAVTVPVVLVIAGSRAAPGAWLDPMEADTGWSTSTLSFAAAIGLVLFGLAGPISGYLVSRLGLRRVVILSLVASAAAMALSSQVNSQWQLHLVFGAFAGLSAGLVASVVGATVATRWFEARRGLVVGLFGAAGSAGLLIFYPLLTALSGEYGWRDASLVLAVILAATVPLAAIFIRDHPTDLGLAPLGGTEVLERPPPLRFGDLFTVLRRVSRTGDFWLLAGTFFVCGATSNGLIGQHFISHATEHGFTENAAARWLAVMGAFNFVGTIASGWLTDRMDPRRLLLAYYGFRGLSLLFLPLAHDNLTIALFAVFFGLDYIATVPPTIALAADRFGRDNIGVVYGWIYAAHQIGAGLAAWITGIVRDQAGEYSPAFYAAGIIAAGAGLAALRIRRGVPAPVG
jgi:predicted MFS family arabinose efflux permease